MKKENNSVPENHIDLPENPVRRRLLQASTAAGILGSVSFDPQAKLSIGHQTLNSKLKDNIKNVVIIYMENRSFNNLFAHFPGVSRPLPELAPEDYLQLDRNGQTLVTLPKIWGGLVQKTQKLGDKKYLIFPTICTRHRSTC